MIHHVSAPFTSSIEPEPGGAPLRSASPPWASTIGNDFTVFVNIQDTQDTARKKPQMNTEKTGKPDLTIPIPSGEEGPGGMGRNRLNVEMSKCSEQKADR